MGTSELLPTPRAGNPGSRPNKKGGKILAEVVATSSRADFPANLFPKQEKDEAQAIIAISGRKCSELYESSTRHGSSLKMCVGFLLSSKAWYSNKSALTWKPVVTKSNRLLFQLFPSTPRTEGIGSGLLGTPRANDIPRTERFGKGRVPTPSELMSMLPTPRVSMGNGASQKEIDQNDPKGRIETRVGIKTGLKLQPAFVEWMMGYPEGWTGLNPSEMPSSPRLRKKL